MCMLPRASAPVVPVPATAACPAHLLNPYQRQPLAVAAPAGARPVSHLAADYPVSRTFVYQQADKAEQARMAAFAPDLPADGRVLLWPPVTAVWLRRLSLALLLVCHSSDRGAYEPLRDLFHYPCARGPIHAVAQAALSRARSRNGQPDLAAVGIGAHDELCQADRPVLVGVAVAPTYCYRLSRDEHRDGETWGVRLLELPGRGFAPRAILGDGGSGLQAGQALARPTAPRRGGAFHVVHEVTPLVTFPEHRAYPALTAGAQLERQQARSERRRGRRDSGVSQQLRHARPAAAAAAAVADDAATLVGWSRRDVLALAGPCHAERAALYGFSVAALQARAPQCPHRLNPACTDLVNQRDAVLAFAEQLDADPGAVAADFQVPPAVVRALLHVQALDVGDARRWPPEAALRQQPRGRSYERSEAVAAGAGRTVRASSVVEDLNSRLRSSSGLRRHLGPDYLHLLQFFRNHRRFLRSEHPERVDHSPAELLTGRPHAHWLELLGLPDPLGN